MYGKHHTKEVRKKNSEAHKGRHHSEETRKKMSESRKGANNPNYGKHHSEESRKKISDSQKGKRSGEKHHLFGKHLTEETKRKIGEANKGAKSGNWNGGTLQCTCLECGKNFDAPPSRIKNGGGKYCSKICQYIGISKRMSGENHHNWKNGASFEPYCHKFNDAFKEYIRDKFDRTCFLCDKTEEANKVKLSIHHVNYSKDCLCDDDIRCQFVPLCISCHSKVHGDRDKWEKYFKNKLRNKLNGWYI